MKVLFLLGTYYEFEPLYAIHILLLGSTSQSTGYYAHYYLTLLIKLGWGRVWGMINNYL